MSDAQHQATTRPPPLTPAARMRNARQRWQNGIRVIPVELRDTEIEALATCGLLHPANRDHKDSIGGAIGKLLDGLPPPQQWPELLALCRLLDRIPADRWWEVRSMIERRFPT